MIAILQKEIRTIGPGFLVAISACLAPFVFTSENILIGITRTALPILFAFGCVFMGADVFGVEFHRGTLSMLLSQPISRALIWRRKMQILATGLLLSTGSLTLAIMIWAHSQEAHFGFNRAYFWTGFALIPTMAFCTTPLWTLLCRNTLLGILFTIITPSFLLTLNLFVREQFPLGTYSTHAFVVSNYVLLFSYSLLSLFLGYRKFQRLEVAGPSGIAFRELILPGRLERLFRWPAARKSSAWKALLKKEFRLQQITFIAAGLFCFIGIIGGIFYYFHVGSGWIRFKFAEPLLITNLVIYILLVPLMTGAVAVAEEKSWGLTEWQMTFPPSVRFQWFTKMLVTLGTGFGLGVVLPLVGGLFGKLILFGWPTMDSPGSDVSLTGLFLLAGVHLQLLLTSTVIYAGCFTRSTVASLVLAFIMVIVGGIAFRFGLALVPSYDLAMQARALATADASVYRFCLWLIAMGIAILFCFTQLFAYIAYRRNGLTMSGKLAQWSILLGFICFLGFILGGLATLFE